MKKNCIIICWLGKLPDYYKLWEYSCSLNTDYDFFVFSDQDYRSEFSNILFIKTTLGDLSKLFSEKLDLDIELKNAYKLCDFKPIYGKIFEDYIGDYEFWGHCDMDQVFGKISNFVSKEHLEKYDRINQVGHFTLYRNNDEMKNLYKKSGSKFSYKEVFQNEQHYAFDEYSGMKLIVEKNNIKNININDYADIDVKHSRFMCVNNKNYDLQAYTWENGILKKIYLEDNIIKSKEVMYLHFQKKKPRLEVADYSKAIIIGKNIFENFEVLDTNLIEKVNGHKKVLKEKFEICNYLMNKIKHFILISPKEKEIWLKQKLKYKE